MRNLAGWLSLTNTLTLACVFLPGDVCWAPAGKYCAHEKNAEVSVFQKGHGWRTAEPTVTSEATQSGPRFNPASCFTLG